MSEQQHPKVFGRGSTHASGGSTVGAPANAPLATFDTTAASADDCVALKLPVINTFHAQAPKVIEKNKTEAAKHVSFAIERKAPSLLGIGPCSQSFCTCSLEWLLTCGQCPEAARFAQVVRVARSRHDLAAAPRG